MGVILLLGKKAFLWVERLLGNSLLKGQNGVQKIRFFKASLRWIVLGNLLGFPFSTLDCPKVSPLQNSTLFQRF